MANERWDRFQQKRIAEAQADAERQGREAAERELAARKAGGPLGAGVARFPEPAGAGVSLGNAAVLLLIAVLAGAVLH